MKNIALVAHDNLKKDLVEWVKFNWETLSKHQLICTGTTGKLIQDAISKIFPEDLEKTNTIIKLKSGPFGGDQQLGAMIVDDKVDILIFFWDPMEPQAHEVDIKALLRISVLYNVPTACNKSTADFLISSLLMENNYQKELKDYSDYLNRQIKM